MVQLFFYSTVGCHLCEDAMALLSPLLPATQYQLVEIDIAESDELTDCYGIRIPVIQRNDSKEELGWPFDQHQLQRFLE